MEYANQIQEFTKRSVSGYASGCTQCVLAGSVPFDYVPINHSHSQQPVFKSFPLFKRCKWLVINRDVVKRILFVLAVF